MARPKSVDGGLKKTVAFRLTEADHAAYKAKFEASGLTQSEFFRRYVLTNQTTVIAKSKPSIDKTRLVFLVNKSSNNLNQLAATANSVNKAGFVREGIYFGILQELQQISYLMKAAVNGTD